jgi:hypothetical protein
MFRPRECFKAAVVCPVIAYVVETAVYHHTRHDAVIFAVIIGAIPAFFGFVGLLGG